MKKSIFVIMMALVSMVGMAQHHSGKPGGNGHNKEHYEVFRPAPPCASHDQVAMSLRVIEDQSFDDKKLEIAKLCVTLAPFEVRDLASIAAKFSFDDSRKAFLIYAYRTCCDPENYYYLRDVFSFRSNFDEMMEAVMPGYLR